MQRKAIAALMISLLLLSACGHGAGERSFQTFRDTLTGSLVTVTAQVHADYGDTVADYTLTCRELADGYDLTVIAPETAEGVGAHLRRGESTLTFDDILLPAGDLNAAGLTPLTALPYVVDAIRSGYVDLTWQEGGLQVVQLITDDHTVVRLYLDGTVPQCAELSVDERSCLYCTVEQWNLEQGSTNDESQNSNMGRIEVSMIWNTTTARSAAARRTAARCSASARPTPTATARCAWRSACSGRAASGSPSTAMTRPRLRAAAGVTMNILLLGPQSANIAVDLATLGVTQAVGSIEYARELNRFLAGTGLRLNAHMKLETGMGRTGFDVHDDSHLDEMLEALSLPHLNFTGVFTHFAVSDENGDPYTQLQFSRFLHAIDRMEQASGHHFAIRHCANSGAVINYPQMHLDMVRPGLLLYGVFPAAETGGLDLRPAMSLYSRVSEVTHHHAGDTISYGRTFSPARTICVWPCCRSAMLTGCCAVPARATCCCTASAHRRSAASAWICAWSMSRTFPRCSPATWPRSSAAISRWQSRRKRPAPSRMSCCAP